MTALYLEWGQDLVLTPNGSLQLATGWDEVRQRILRRMLTNPAFTAPDGRPIQADYIFDDTYGIGLPVLVGGNLTSQLFEQLKQAITKGVLLDAAVDTSQPPAIVFQQPDPQTMIISVQVILLTGQVGQIVLQVT